MEESKTFYFVLSDNTVYSEQLKPFKTFYRSKYFGKLEFKEITASGRSTKGKFKLMTENKEDAEKLSTTLKKEYEMTEKYNFVMNNVLGPLTWGVIDKLFEIFKDCPRQFKFKESSRAESRVFVGFSSSDVILARNYATRHLEKINLFKKYYDYGTHKMCEGWIIEPEDLKYLHELRKQLFAKEECEY